MLQLEMLSEPVAVEEVYVSGLAHVEDMGDGNYRLTFFQRRQSLYGGVENVVACRMVATPQAMLDGVKTVMGALGRRCCGVGLRVH